MLEFIGLTRRRHTDAAQAQDDHKEEGAEDSASHGVIKAPCGSYGKRVSGGLIFVGIFPAYLNISMAL
jgi:hypothetical protein